MIRIAAALLFLATLAVWFVAVGARPGARLQIRFAAVLLAAPAIASLVLPAATPAVAALVLPIALAVLALAAAAGLAQPPSVGTASLILVLASLGGIGTGITAILAFALAPAALAIAALIYLFARDATGLAAAQGILAAFCFLGAAAAFALEGADFGLLLFLAAGLLGTGLALSRSNLAAEDKPARRRFALSIGRGAKP
jgi:hypothetical protein